MKKLNEMSLYNFNDKYSADEYGNVYFNYDCKFTKVKAGDKVKSFINKYGYVEYVLSDKEKKRRHIQAHRIVACLYIDNKDNKYYVNHIDGNKLNNHKDNLEWCTASENEKHSYQILKKMPNKPNIGKNGYDYNKGSLEVGQYTMDGELVKIWFRPSVAEKEGGFSAKSISAVCKGNCKTHKGFKWKYL
jgi:protein-disulfide isomerase